MADITGTSGVDRINGTNGADNVWGLQGDDALKGMAGADYLNGGEGNDEISDSNTYGPDHEVDTLVGGSGDDGYFIFDDLNSIIEVAGEGNDWITVGLDVNLQTTFAALTMADNVEGFSVGVRIPSAFSLNQFAVDFDVVGNAADNEIWGTGGSNNLNGLAGNDILYGLNGNDTLIGAEGFDVLYGGAGDDQYRIDQSQLSEGALVADEVAEEIDEGIDTVFANVYEYVLPENVENLTMSGKGNAQTMPGKDGRRSAWGNDLDNLITGRDPSETVAEGNALDPVASDNIYGGNGNDTIVGRGGNDLLEGGLGFDSLLGGVGNDTLSGNDGNDTLDGGAGLDYLTGGLGNDTYVVDQTLNEIGVYETDAVFELANQGTRDLVITNVENFVLPDNVEFLNTSAHFASGNELNNKIVVQATEYSSTLTKYEGKGGVDTMDGGVADVYFDGGEGDDLLNGGDGNDYLIGGNGIDHLNGGLGNDTLVDDTDGDILDGGAGDDTYYIYGSGAADTSEFGSLTDLPSIKLTEAVGQGYDIMYTAMSFISGDGTYGTAGIDEVHLLGANDLWLQLDDAASTLVYGNAGNNIINVTAGNDTVYGGGGADTLIGGVGDHLYFVDSADDVVIEGASTDPLGWDIMVSSVSYGLSPEANGIEGLELSGAVDINAVGNSLANRLVGNAGNNVVDGLDGNDDILGNEGDDTLYGRDGEDILWGGAGADALSGGLGNDQLSGDEGSDVLMGGEGGDIYYFSTNFGADTIVEDDPSPVDIGNGINVDELSFQDASYNKLWFTRAQDDLRIDEVGTGSSVIIAGWYIDASHQVEQVTAVTDGMRLDTQGVNLLVGAMSQFSPQDMSSSQTSAILIAARDAAWSSI